uniref:Gypsy retrotransposon integrase-like protein 1 n=1 Tax=Oryzias latipes TaxID=8090 RepID=A0A3P9J3I3_ORYLA
MVRGGIIEPSDSPWASGVVMVKKKTGPKMRFCVDYRPLNGVTKKDSYPLPRIDESLDLVSGSSWFSSLDLRSGYWQVPLSPEARPKTAFCTGRGLWQFRVLSFGLCNAPATFERLMEKVLASIPRQECLVYLDDILVHGGSFKAALESLRKVLQRIAAAGLKLHPDKCCFMRRELEFLGHRIGSEGISTLEEKVQAVRDWPTPTTLRDLKSFLGLASYYRRFVRGFSCIAAPLFHLQKKDCDFVWTQECEQAFSSLKKALTNSPILTPPDPKLPFILDTDASDVGMGAVLSQMGSAGERVVAYFSKTFSKAERRYCVTRRELLAVVKAIGHFRYYLCGLPFTVRTDHSALQWLMTFKEPEGQIARWLEELASFSFTVEHRPGSRHANADAMSRRPCALAGCQYCEKREAREAVISREEQSHTGESSWPVCRLVQGVDPTEWRAHQEQDVDLQPVLQWVEAGRKPEWGEVAGCSPGSKGLFEKFDALRLKDGVLQRAWKEPATGEERWQVVVPRTLRNSVLQGCHGAAGSGHFGVSKTLRRIRQGFYWGQLRRDVEDFCRRCDICTAHKGPPDRSRAELQQLAAGAPMERVAVDIMGPFPRTNRGNRFVLVAMDYFTKWPEAYAIPDQEAVTVADALVEGMFSRFGAAEVIHSDQGRNFESAVFSAMCERLGMRKTRTTPLHPQSDGLVERFNRTLVKQLAILTSAHQSDWDEHLPLVLMAYRSAVQDSTLCTPALLMLGRELRTPAEMSFGKPPDALGAPPGPEYARKLQDRMDTAHAFARNQLEKAGIRQKRNYDLRAKGKDFKAGDLVWVYNPKRKKGRCPKLDCQWVGPCEVLEKLGEVVYRVELPPGGRRVTLHRDRLAPYRGDARPQQYFGRSLPPSATPTLARAGPPANSPHAPPQQQVVSGHHMAPSVPAPRRPRRLRRPPPHLRDFVCDPTGRGTL